MKELEEIKSPLRKVSSYCAITNPKTATPYEPTIVKKVEPKKTLDTPVSSFIKTPKNPVHRDFETSNLKGKARVVSVPPKKAYR